MASPAAAALTPRRVLAVGIAAAALGIGALGAADAQAAFTLGRCQGASGVTGQGASFQADLHRNFATLFNGALAGCGGSPTAPQFTANGSGAGLGSAGAGSRSADILCRRLNVCGNADGLPAGERDLTVSFQASDDPPSTEQYNNMKAGLSSTTADDAKLHIVPVATGSAVLIMRLPQGCSIKADGATTLTGSASGDSFANGTQRPLVPGADVEAAFAGELTTWGDLVPTISGTPTSGQYAGLSIADCADVPVRRIVRQDNSGTTFSWKAYLGLINPNRGWTTTYAGNPNTNWPGAATPTRIDTATTQVCPIGGANLCSNTGSGGGALADAVNLVDGSIGYVDLATARGRNFWNASTRDTQDQTIWVPLEIDPEHASGRFAEPTAEPTAHNSASAQKGAACEAVDVKNAPTPANSPDGDPTQGDWSRAYAAGGRTTYPACVLTYALLWDDNAVVYGASDAQQAKARTVKDYFSLMVSVVGQSYLLGYDYSPVPNTAAQPLLTYAQNAVAAIDWNKSATGQNPDTRQPETRQPETRQPETRQPETRTPPSNAFSIPSSKTSATLLTFTVQLPGAGSLRAVATTKVGKRTIRVGSASGTVKGAGRVTLRVKLSAAAKKALARAKSKKLTVKVAFTYTPTGGTAKTVTKNVTVKAAKRKPAKRKAAKR